MFSNTWQRKQKRDNKNCGYSPAQLCEKSSGSNSVQFLKLRDGHLSCQRIPKNVSGCKANVFGKSLARNVLVYLIRISSTSEVFLKSIAAQEAVCWFGHYTLVQTSREIAEFGRIMLCSFSAVLFATFWLKFLSGSLCTVFTCLRIKVIWK